jgi:PadR family transcriptional regulator PadR
VIEQMAITAAGSLLDLCVLSILSRADEYGYSLTQKVKGVLDVSESTMYPVMRRLQSDDCLSVYDMPYSGRNRRYYKITANGEKILGGYLTEWEDFKGKIDGLLSGYNIIEGEKQ